MALRILYPNDGFISEEEVIAWALDRMIDNAIQNENFRRERDCEMPLDADGCQTIADTVDHPTLEDAIERLQDDGVATFRRQRSDDGN